MKNCAYLQEKILPPVWMGGYTFNPWQVEFDKKQVHRHSIKKLTQGCSHHSLSFQTELAEQKKIVEDYRAKLLALETEMQSLRDQAFAHKDVMKSRTKSMVCTYSKI